MKVIISEYEKVVVIRHIPETLEEAAILLRLANNSRKATSFVSTSFHKGISSSIESSISIPIVNNSNKECWISTTNNTRKK